MPIDIGRRTSAATAGLPAVETTSSCLPRPARHPPSSSTPMRTTALVLALIAPALLDAQREAPVRYDVSFPNAVHHEALITVEFSAVPAGSLALRMSRSSPGRYALHEFAKNVYGVRVMDGTGRPLRVTRSNPHQWNVATA